MDWIALAVIKARKALPELTFDIYGHGPEQERIEKIIQEHHAQDYIRLKGHVNLQDVYRHYQLFVAASQSEGFGLTLMEAVGSGLGMIGFDVNYGSPTFIKDARNGYLIPINLIENPSTTSQITWRLRSSNILKMAPHTRTIYHTKLLRSLRQLI